MALKRVLSREINAGKENQTSTSHMDVNFWQKCTGTIMQCSKGKSELISISPTHTFKLICAALVAHFYTCLLRHKKAQFYFDNSSADLICTTVLLSAARELPIKFQIETFFTD